MINNDLELKKLMAEYACKDFDISELADCYKTITFTDNADYSALLDSPYAIRVDKEVNDNG